MDDESEQPEELKTKVYLLRHFENYMRDRLFGEHAFCWDDLERTKGMDHVQKYFRMKHVIVFKLSHDVIQVRANKNNGAEKQNADTMCFLPAQFNFYDHTKLILSSRGLAVTYLDKHYKIWNRTLPSVMRNALADAKGGPSSGSNLDADEAERRKADARLFHKLKYAREVLQSIRAVSHAAASVSPVEI